MKRRRLPDFETCSVALFASLARGGSLWPGRLSPPAGRASAGKAKAHGPATRHAAMAPALLHRFDRPEGSPKDGSVSSAAFDEALK